MINITFIPTKAEFLSSAHKISNIIQGENIELDAVYDNDYEDSLYSKWKECHVILVDREDTDIISLYVKDEWDIIPLVDYIEWLSVE